MGDSSLHKIESTYSDRFHNHSLFKESWIAFASNYPPSHCLLDFNQLPSTDVALHCGDLGFALLWIVQSVLIRCVYFDINQLQPWEIPALTPVTIGAMAHTEPDTARMTARYIDNNTLSLSGHKKYITGGKDADLLFVTARRTGEDKFTKIVYIQTYLLPENALQQLDMSILPTINHATLTLDDFPCNALQCSPVKDKELRKILKKWSLVERALIGEAYIGYLCYLAKNITMPDQKELIDEVENLLALQKTFTRQQLENAFSNNYIDTLGDVARVLSVTQKISNYCMENPQTPGDSITLRLHDLNLFNKIRL